MIGENSNILLLLIAHMVDQVIGILRNATFYIPGADPPDPGRCQVLRLKQVTHHATEAAYPCGIVIFHIASHQRRLTPLLDQCDIGGVGIFAQGSRQVVHIRFHP
ncbi:hypothetical protein RAA17_03105 [Komagataeibacter rhaeticus]|nr:hypothetical protein [Komagataeibacter rhaeticus]